MATQTSANINMNFDTFAGVVAKVNEILTDISTIVVTAAANTIGASTTGNSSIVGIFNANTVTVGTSIRGGTIATPAALTISSNLVSNSALSTFTSNVVVTGANTTLTSAVVMNGASFLANTPSTFANTLSVTGNTTLVNTSINGNIIQSGTGTFGLSGSRWNVFSQNTDTVNLSANVVSANLVSISTIADIKPVSIALGTNTTSPQVITSIPTATYRSGTLTVQSTSGAGDYQSENFLFVQNTANVYYSTSGIVFSNTQLHTMDAAINGSNVDIRITQNVASLNIRLIAQLMKV